MSNKRAKITIDLNAISSNIRLALKSNPSSKVIAVIKADAYGLGAVPVARHLEKEDMIEGFAVATTEEGVILKNEGIKKKIFLVSASFEDDYEAIIKNDLIPTITGLEDAKKLSDIARKLGKEVSIDIKIDTGMGRIGFPSNRESVDKIIDIFKMQGLNPAGIFTHFPCADQEDQSSTKLSYERFVDMVEALRARGVDFKYIHCQNSAASLAFKADCTNLIRIGVLAYGVNPLLYDRFAGDIKNVVSYKSHIIFIKEVLSGTPISYGSTFVTDDISRIATVPVGYADGIPRDMSNKGYVLIHGQRAPIVGRVCMDQMMVDVTGIPKADVLDEVTILGSDGDESISIEDMAAMSKRFSYELLTCFNKRVFRQYI